MIPGEYEGQFDAPIVVVGEAWGANEDYMKRPFIGPSGQLLHEWLTSIGHTRLDCFITNVVCERPPNNDLSAISADALAQWTTQLHERLALTSPRVIVACGNAALRALTRKNMKVGAFRGSTLQYTMADGRTVPLVPVLHPAAVLRQPSWNARCLSDWQRIKALIEGNGKVAHEITACIWPSAEANDAMWTIIGSGKPLALDIETIPDARIITSVAFAIEKDWALVFPTLPSELLPRMGGEQWRDGDPFTLIKHLCALGAPKVMQNGFYDWHWLKNVARIDITNYLYDPRWMHHALHPNDEHSLAYLASRYTRHDAWKHRARSGIRSEQLLYNAMDAAITIEVYEGLLAELREQGLEQFYLQHYAALYRPLFDIMQRGIRVDSKKRAAKRDELAARCDAIRTRVNALTGVDDEALATATECIQRCRSLKAEFKGVKGKHVTALRKDISAWLNAAKTMHKEHLSRSLYSSEGGESFEKTKHHLYVVRKLPKRVRDGKLSADETALRSLRLRFGTRDAALAELLDLLIEQRGKAKLASTFLSDKIEDDDGRVRCEYTFTPKNGRLSSGSNPFDKGANLQNVAREIRDIYLPDPGEVLLECDLSQAEWRVVAMLTHDPELSRLANTRPHEFDIHKHNATLIFHCAYDTVDKAQRRLAKVGAHAADYDMHARRYQDILLNEGIVRTLDECQQHLDDYFAKCPQIRTWQYATRQEVMRFRCLSNSWGRMIRFDGERLDDELYRFAYSWRPSSEVADILNQWGVLPMYERGYQACLQVHDALYYSVRPDDAYDLALALRDSLERPRTYNGVELVIPATFTIRDTWGSGQEFLQLPDRDEFTRVARELTMQS